MKIQFVAWERVYSEELDDPNFVDFFSFFGELYLILHLGLGTQQAENFKSRKILTR